LYLDIGNGYRWKRYTNFVILETCRLQMEHVIQQ